MHDCFVKGCSLWCKNCNKSYNTLCIRWRISPALKAWWNSLSATAQREWFVKWGLMSAKDRAACMEHIDTAEDAQEDIEDEIDKWITYDKFCTIHPTWTETQLLAEWNSIIELHESECIIRRGRWLIPFFEGVERRVRSRHTEATKVQRTTEITDEKQVESLLGQGRTRIARWRENVPSVITAPANDPVLDARPVDQPHRAPSHGVIADSIKREVVCTSNWGGTADDTFRRR